jgi:tetratricopeptide (TPR) repeat protein
MPGPRAVVIPFGVPAEGRGLGLGLAALVHVCVHVDGGGVAIAQLHARRKDEPPDAKPSPVEAFVAPAQWKDIADRGETPAEVGVVVTGAFEPPVDGHGTLQLLAFDARDGRTRARVDAQLDELHAGASLVAALEQLGAATSGPLGALEALRELDWEPLESVLRAERCALHDPLKGGPHDRLAAMQHLGRAIADAPAARYPIERLASLALETALGSAVDGKLAAAAARALQRAVGDAPGRVELVEALAALELRLGQAQDAERRLNAALSATPKRARLYVLLSQALRIQGRIDAALTVLQSGQHEVGADPLLASERGVVLAARGDLGGAALAWREALARDAVQPAAFGNLAALVLRTSDAATAEVLVDAALASPQAHPEVLRRAVQLALATEAEGIARHSRVARLSTRLLEMLPDEPWATLALAKAEASLGDRGSARARLQHVERIAPRTTAAAEAQAARLSIDDPAADAEVKSVLRAAQSATAGDLLDIAARARRLATAHASWPAWIASALAQRRLERWTGAREALEAAIEIAPGATVAHVELAETLLALGQAPAAVERARHAVTLEGNTPRTLAVLARALAKAGHAAEARETARQVLALQPDHPQARAVLDGLPSGGEPGGWWSRVRAAWQGFRGR